MDDISIDCGIPERHRDRKGHQAKKCPRGYSSVRLEVTRKLSTATENIIKRFSCGKQSEKGGRAELIEEKDADQRS